PHLLDAFGPATVGAYQAAMADGGRIIAVAGLPGDIRPGITAHGMHAEPVGADMAELAALMEAGQLRTTLYEVFPLERLAEAHETLAGGHVRGKVVIKIGP